MTKRLSLFCATVLSALVLLPAIHAQSLDSEESAFLGLLNNYRASNGVGGLALSAALTNASKWMSTDMASKNYLSHTDSLGRDPGTRIAAFGYPFFPWGENIAAGYASGLDTLNQWINACDPDGSGVCTYAHRNNMLNGGFKVIGIGRASGGTYGWYWTTDFGGVVDQPQNPAPLISSFSALPAVITGGQSATLSWSVSGATALTIDNGVGNVMGITFATVSPVVTTVYILTATNAAGTSGASVTVTVNAPPTQDNQPPTAPVLTSAIAVSVKEVDLTWNPATDNIGVVGYQILRNGSVAATLPASARAWVDNGVLAGTSYTYTAKAFDAAGNYSAAGNAIVVSTPAPPAGISCPAAAVNAFTGCYFNNISLTGSPVFVRTDNQINFDWPGGTTPAPAVPAAFSARWQGSFDFDQATYTFTALASDGIRVYIDSAQFPAIDRWSDHPLSRYTVQLPMTLGRHLIVVEYYEETGSGAAHVSWQSQGAVSVPLPAISYFLAAPSSITFGQSFNLSWNVSGANAIAIDNGIGSVTSPGSRTVSPAATTTYKLTATNSSGSTAAVVTVTVTAPAADTQPPTAPVLTSAVAKSATEVDLTWTASTDNVGIAGYQILRNGSVAGSVTASILAWADTSVLANTAYTYSVKAFDAAANYSTASNAVAVTTPAPATTGGGCVAPATNAFTGCYFSNTTLSGNPVLIRTDSQINFDWPGTTPGPGVPAAFSTRWQGNFDFEQATYTFSVITSDGMRVYIDGNPMPALDKWSDHPPYRYTFQTAFSAGRHLVVVEYYEETGTATAHLSWQ